MVVQAASSRPGLSLPLLVLAVLKERLCGQVINGCSCLSGASHHSGILVLSEELQDVPCGWGVGLPGAMAPQNLLPQEPHAWDACAQHVELRLELLALATDLFMEVDDFHGFFL